MAIFCAVAGCAHTDGSVAAKPTEYRPGQTVTVQGRLSRGVECRALIAEDGTLYTLMGDLKGFGIGDMVCVRGRVVEYSYCMQGITIGVDWIGADCGQTGQSPGN